MQRKKNIEMMRPFGLNQKMLLLREKCGVKFYLNENSNFVEINCPACGEDKDIKLKFYKYGFSHIKCSNCSTLYVSPRPTQNLLFNYYANYEAPNFWTEILVKTNNDRKYLQHLPRVEKLKDILKDLNNKLKTFVDLGAGNGNFSKAILEANKFKDVIASDSSIFSESLSSTSSFEK